MSKITKQKDSKKKRRISAVKASAESYFKLHWFLLYEDKYRKLSPKAKLLYGLLRSRFELSNTNVQNGVPDADNFIDEENNIFCIFDNVEISFLLDMSVPTVIDAKKELDEAELLEEVQIKDQANRMYVLDPVLDSDMWTFKQQLADIKAKKAEKDKERVRKQKEKRQQKALEKKQEKAKKKALANGVVNVGNENAEGKSCDSKNLIHTKKDDSADFCDSKNLIHVSKDFLDNITRVFNLLDLKDLSKYVSSGETQSVLEFYKIFFKLSKYAEINLVKFIEERSASIVLEAIVRMIDKDDIKSPIAFIKKTLNNWSGCKTVEEVLKHEEEYRKQQNQKYESKNKVSKQRKVVRKEMVPEWFKENKHKENAPKEEVDADFEEEKRKLEQELKDLHQELKAKNKKPKEKDPVSEDQLLKVAKFKLKHQPENLTEQEKDLLKQQGLWKEPVIA